MSNTIIDLIIRLKNGYMARKETVEISYSCFARSVLEKLKELSFIKDYSMDGEKKKKFTVSLLYDEGVPALTDVKIFSKPGYRIYTNYKDLKSVLGGLGCSILSTSKGVLTNREARKAKVGGELLFSLW